MIIWNQRAVPCPGIDKRTLSIALLVAFSVPASVRAAEPAEALNREAMVETKDDAGEAATDTISVDDPKVGPGYSVWADLRPIFTSARLDRGDGLRFGDEDLGLRARLSARTHILRSLWAGAGVGGRYFADDGDFEFILQHEIPGPNGLATGQGTIDELYLHWFREGAARFDFILGRQQTRFALRSGVYYKSLDRNDSNNSRVTWTDGLHADYYAPNGWRSHFVLQRNFDEGTGSIRRGPMDYSDSAAKNTYFLAFENVQPWGVVVQRGFDVSYLPATLLKDGGTEATRTDYWGLVARLALRWPTLNEGTHFRGGVEAGYAPEVPTKAAMGYDNGGDSDGLAWNVAANVIDIWPGHSAGFNYGRTGAGWLLSPQFFPGTELIEFRYLLRLKKGPVLEARVRRQKDLDASIAALSKRSEHDIYFRMTWEFGGGFATRGL